MSKSWYSRSHDIEYKDGHVEKEYYLVFETTDKKLARRIEKIFQNIMDGIEPKKKKGRWLLNPFDRAWDMCSECGTGTKRREYGTNPNGTEWVTEYSYPYCPWCCVKMGEQK